ncbi:MAG: hypothetical protein V4566_04925 [Pseudomonadota bacterium]
MVISDGALVNGAVMLTNAATSYTLGYDAAGNATMRTTIDASTSATMAQASYYDARNELVQANYAVNLSNGTARGIEEERQYDAAGVLSAVRVAFFPDRQGHFLQNAATSTHSNVKKFDCEHLKRAPPRSQPPFFDNLSSR